MGPLRQAGKPREWTHFISCRLLPAPEEALAYAAGAKAVAPIFDRVEAACPNLFHPPGPVTEEAPQWLRRYSMGTEMQVWIEDGKVRYYNSLRGGDPIEIGAAADWAHGPQPIDCSKRFASAFGGIAD